MQELSIVDLKIGFYAKFNVYIHIIRSRSLRLGQYIRKMF